MEQQENTFEPQIVAFCCKWCTSAGADLAGTSRMEYAPNVTGVTLMCSSRVGPDHILTAFESGADGVLIGGCHPGDCHYEGGNYQTLKRTTILKQVLNELNIDDSRLRLEWISSSEGKKFAKVIDEFTDRIKKLGKLKREPL
ncbi:MAG: hydrogenase iron-sulfur subunit [Planctomycetota bacterium]|jgi:F420-non-reducing hydrogenase iron-sulfur subunit